MTHIPQPPAHIPAGWYQHPNDPTQQQFWDGSAWTAAVAPRTDIAARTDIVPFTPTSAPASNIAPNAPVAYQQPSPYVQTPYGGIPYARPLKESGTAYLLAILLGGVGAHQFYLGNVGAGIGFIALWWGGWALSFIGIGFLAILAAVIWWIVDLCTMQSQVDTANRRLITGTY
ncbi:NINE protein [Plantibacter flavus]|uniref:TM2 domain-containing protein n=1 Tax=Plantibacter flavus TaxID=150123 RepID=UPI003F17E69E